MPGAVAELCVLDGPLYARDARSVIVEHIRSRLQGGFRPFAVVTSSGHKFPVPHPDFVFITPRTVVVADEDGYTVNLDPLHIVGLEDIPMRRNGGQKPRRRRKRP